MVTMIVVLSLSGINIGLIVLMTNRVIRAIQDSSALDHGRVVYESEQVGTLTVYSGDAVLELLDGSIVVIPRMAEAVPPNA